ncbi:MAG: RNA polymerase subunit sigma-70 [Hespellia sp.]|nr:RNA polymerase subunit sigma-70 [Hespellia sp.]
MTNQQKEQIVKLRNEGYGYIRIAQALEVSENTVKSFCRRNNLTGSKEVIAPKDIMPSDNGEHFCLCCGKPVEQNPGRKQKKFCSDKCRNIWWNKNLDKVNRKANYEFICPHCKKPFIVYGNANRKYCSHECYIADRFGGGLDDR